MSTLEKLELAKAKEYLTIDDVALISNLSKSTIRNSIKSGRLKAIQEDKRCRILFKKLDVMNFIERGIYG